MLQTAGAKELAVGCDFDRMIWFTGDICHAEGSGGNLPPRHDGRGYLQG